jgi:hypothetical protein
VFFDLFIAPSQCCGLRCVGCPLAPHCRTPISVTIRLSSALPCQTSDFCGLTLLLCYRQNGKGTLCVTVETCVTLTTSFARSDTSPSASMAPAQPRVGLIRGDFLGDAGFVGDSMSTISELDGDRCYGSYPSRIQDRYVPFLCRLSVVSRIV